MIVKLATPKESFLELTRLPEFLRKTANLRKYRSLRKNFPHEGYEKAVWRGA
jgi:hypothetical protein